MSDPGEPNLLTSQEVADLFRVDRNTIRRWAQEGRLRSVHPAGTRTLRFYREDVEALLMPQSEAVGE